MTTTDVCYIPAPPLTTMVDALVLGAEWLDARARHDQADGIVVVPRVGGAVCADLEHLAPRFRLQPPRDLARGAWSHGPALAVWPSRRVLRELCDRRAATAVCVVQRTTRMATQWLWARRASDLSGATGGLGAPDLGHPVVRCALGWLHAFVHLDTRLLEPGDREVALAILHALHTGSYEVRPPSVYAWAVAHGWQDAGAAALQELAVQTVRGGEHGPHSMLRADAIAAWEAEAAGREAPAGDASR